jgi:CYTH domain-containing protein
MVGLVIAEIELENENEVVPFPECFNGIWKWEVTENRFFKNQEIATNGLPTWPYVKSIDNFWLSKKQEGCIIE